MRVINRDGGKKRKERIKEKKKWSGWAASGCRRPDIPIFDVNMKKWSGGSVEPLFFYFSVRANSRIV